MNSETWLKKFDIKTIKRDQEKEFIENVGFRNQKVAKEIIHTYDMKHSCLKNTIESFGNIDKLKEIYEKYLSERKKFFDYISEYL
jgi:hypothetical protein